MLSARAKKQDECVSHNLISSARPQAGKRGALSREAPNRGVAGGRVEAVCLYSTVKALPSSTGAG